MHAKSAVAVALLASMASAGSAIVKNECSFPVYLWSVTDTPGEMNTLHTGQSYSEGYKTNPDGGGVSIKLATQPNSYGTVTQFEYTVTDTLWYDMSNINGYPFMKWGMTLVPSSSGCRNILCPANVEECSDAYNTPDQNQATASCGLDSNLSLVLCSGQDNTQTPAQSAKDTVGHALQSVSNVEVQHKNKHHDEHHHKHEHHHKNKSHHDHKKHHGKHHHKQQEPVPAPPAPAPPAPAPVITSASAVVSSVAGVATTFVTEIVTVAAREAKPSAAPEAHAHANYHRHHFHRHS